MTPKQKVKTVYPQASLDYYESRPNAYYIRTSIAQGHGAIVSDIKETPRAAWGNTYERLRDAGLVK